MLSYMLGRMREASHQHRVSLLSRIHLKKCSRLVPNTNPQYMYPRPKFEWIRGIVCHRYQSRKFWNNWSYAFRNRHGFIAFERWVKVTVPRQVSSNYSSFRWLKLWEIHHQKKLRSHISQRLNRYQSFVLTSFQANDLCDKFNFT